MNVKKEIININDLIDTYGSLLTKRQLNIIKEKYQFDLSLKEISEIHKISRSAVLDSIHKTNKKLKSYENKLKLVYKKSKILSLIDDKFLKEKIKEIL